ncbi:MAG TPA: hypothetical protein VGR15_01075 [Bacteroidota bacterium]|jgi:hypothetical protein|nr:hypothetical protein [Bacteroidota bacterium]
MDDRPMAVIFFAACILVTIDRATAQIEPTNYTLTSNWTAGKMKADRLSSGGGYARQTAGVPASGVYFYSLTAGKTRVTGKMLLTK